MRWWLWGSRGCDAITTQDIRELLTKRLATTSPTYRNGILKFIRGAFNHGVEIEDAYIIGDFGVRMIAPDKYAISSEPKSLKQGN